MFPPRLFLVYCLYLVIAFLVTQFILRFWKPKELADKQATIILLIMIVVHAVFYYFTYMIMFYNFRAGATDLLTFVQSLWNISEGEVPFLSQQQTHLLRDHFSLLWYLVAPVFKLWPGVEWLVLLSTLFVAATAYVIYLMSRNELESSLLVLALAVSYLLNPYIQLSQLAAGHVECFSVLIISCCLLAMQKSKWVWFFILMALSLISKEDVGLYFGGVGAYIFLGMKKPKAGIVTAVIGIIYSITVVKFVMPLFGPDTQNLIMKYFSDLGSTSTEVIKTILLQPWKALALMMKWEKIFPLFYIVAQTGFVSLLSGWAVVPLAISLGFKSVTGYTAMFNYWDHYFLHVAPFFYFATIVGIKHLLNSDKLQWLKWKLPGMEKITTTGLAVFILLASLLINLERGNTPLSRKFKLSDYKITEHSHIGLNLIKEIPENASVLVQETLAPHFSLRKKVRAITFYKSWKEQKNMLDESDYVVIDEKYPFAVKVGTIFEDAVAWLDQDRRFEAVTNTDGWRIYKRIAEVEGEQGEE